MNEFIPPADEQAAEILRELQANGFDTRGLTVTDIEQAIDPAKPVSVNFKTVAEGLR